MILFWLSLTLAVLSGLARAGFSTREYHGLDSRIYDWMSMRKRHWFVGGEGYNQSRIWTADFKHVCIFLKTWLMSLAGMVLGAHAYEQGTWLWFLALPVLWGAEGWSFTFFFHYIFSPEPDGTLLHYLKRVLRPWK